MNMEHLAARQISDHAFQWYCEYLTAIDTKNVVAYGAFLTEDSVMVQNNQAPVSGKQAILEALSQYWRTFDSITHDLLNIYGSDAAFALEAWNHYVRLDGGKVSVRAAAFTQRNSAGLVKAFRFYTDVSPVFAK